MIDCVMQPVRAARLRLLLVRQNSRFPLRRCQRKGLGLVKRGRFLLRTLGAAATAVLRLIGLNRVLERRRVEFEQRSVVIPDLPEHLDGFTIGVLSDLHVGPATPPRWVRKAVEQLAARKPDLVVALGDYIGSHEHGPAADWALEPVRGALGIIGNWDFKDRFIRHSMRSVRMLVNEGTLAADGLWVGGVDEPRLGEPDVARAMAGAPEGAVRILLCHEPDYADEIVRPEHRVALQISGHSHGGQIRLPLVGPVLLPAGGRKYRAGLYPAPHCQVYVNRGLGNAHLPIRILCPPEITLLKLVRG